MSLECSECDDDSPTVSDAAVYRYGDILIALCPSCKAQLDADLNAEEKGAA